MLIVIVLFLVLVGTVGLSDGKEAASSAPSDPGSSSPAARPSAGSPSSTVSARPERPVAQLPGGGTKVFDHRFLVAYYGTAQTKVLGVLGDGDPASVTRRLRAAARPFHRKGQRTQIVYELIVSVADRSGDRTHDIPRAEVEEYIRLAHRNQAMLVLDLQPGTQRFREVAKRWAWALRDPWVGLALDPEWRMHGDQVPGRVIGHVGAAEVNRTARWLSHLTAENRLPQKLFLLHQFRTSMVHEIASIRHEPHLAMVQHVDGFGGPGAKLATYHAVARPTQFTMGFKLFYVYDKPRMTAQQVLRISPRVSFVSFQ